MDERKLEKRLRRIEDALEAQEQREQHLARKVEALTVEVGAVLELLVPLVDRVARMGHQIKHEHREIEEIERALKPHHYPATTGIHVTAS